jgi:hypothetical protein
MMRSAGICLSLVLALAPPLFGDSNLRIADVGLEGYMGTPGAVRVIVRNPSSESQFIHLLVSLSDSGGTTQTITSDISLSGGEQRQLELPVVFEGGKTKIAAEASAGGSVFGRDSYEGFLRATNLVVLMCASENVCRTAQSQIQFSGSIEEQADKNRGIKFAAMNDPRDVWWAYSAAHAVVLAMPVTGLSSKKRDALEGYLRGGGRLVLLEDEIADPAFLSAYRSGMPSLNGERVGKGILFRVSGLSANTLGNIFTGRNLPAMLQPDRWWAYRADWLRRRFAARFNFPRLSWILLWLAVYIVAIGILNFAVLRRLRRLEFGWISVCGLALLFSVALYFLESRQRPREFRIDNLAAYYLDGRSPLAAADYSLRISAPKRRVVVVSVADPAVFVNSHPRGVEMSSQIWVEIGGVAERANQEYDIRLGPPRQIDLPLLKWSFHDMDLEGLHEFSGTVHFVSPNRLRNDTGQHFGDAVYVDYRAKVFYPLPALAPGEEIQLDTITPKPIPARGERPDPSASPAIAHGNPTLEELAADGLLASAREGERVFAGFSDGPALPVELNIPHQQSAHSLILVALEQP